jgi:hypothetical protein
MSPSSTAPEACRATDFGLSLGAPTIAAMSVSMTLACTGIARVPWWCNSMRMPLVSHAGPTRGGEEQIGHSRTARTVVPLTQAPVHIGGYRLSSVGPPSYRM